MPQYAQLKHSLLEAVRGGGEILRSYYGRVKHVRQKGEQASVVCEADLAAETHIREVILSAFPDSSILGEEEGMSRGSSPYTWVADPLDGTSNFVAELPWFGCQAGVMDSSGPLMTAMYLPVEGVVYFAQRGRGVWRNGKKMVPSKEQSLKKILCAFGFDAAATERERTKSCRLLMRVAGAVRNTRATNSLVDFCLTLEGRLGACINLNCKLWDILPAALMFPELGLRFTDLSGKPIKYDAGLSNPEHTYQVLGAPPRTHAALVKLASSR